MKLTGGNNFIAVLGTGDNCWQRSRKWPVRKRAGNVNGSSGSSVAKVKRHPTVARGRYGVRGCFF